MSYHNNVVTKQARLASIADQWEFLTQKTTEKSLKLKEANKQRTYIAAVKDLDFWLGEVRYSTSLISHRIICCFKYVIFFKFVLVLIYSLIIYVCIG